ncbi:MAG: heme peroxidase family protein [Actinomycetota bacterium]
MTGPKPPSPVPNESPRSDRELDELAGLDTEVSDAVDDGGFRLTRRRAIGAIGIGAAGIGLPAGLVGAQARRNGRGDDGDDDGGGGNRDGRNPTRGGRDRGRGDGNGDGGDGPGRFSRLFDDHPPFAELDDELTEQLVELGRPGGLLDAGDPLEVGPIRLITEPELSPNNPDNPNNTAGTTFMGQFLDHDVTSDGASRLGQPTSVRRSVNLRSARFDLDSVYGGGPDESPQLYRTDDRFQFRVESGGLFEDVPRDGNGVAVIGDPRNDENLIISGIHVAFLRFHNAVLERVRGEGFDGFEAFDRARRLVRWHYQWLILHQFLPQFVGQDLVDDILTNGRRHYTPNRPSIPVEFQTAAYRFGHSLIRPSYRANLAGDDGEPFFALVFDPDTFGQPDPDDLSGGHRAPRRFIGWQTFFDFDDGEVKPNKRIDTRISTPLFQLPMAAIPSQRGEPIGPLSLPTRNLLRHITWGIPSGQDAAVAMGAPILAAADLTDIDAVAPRLAGNTPLWLYVLREAELLADGLHLGPVGGRIVGEVFIGLLQLDPTSYLSAEPGWRPTLPSGSGDGDFRMADLLTIAGVAPVSRGQ